MSNDVKVTLTPNPEIHIDVTPNPEVKVNITPNPEIRVSVDGKGPQGEKGVKGDTGPGLDFKWEGMTLGVKKQEDTDYQYVNLTPADATYVHKQIASSKSWVINHKLNKKPSVNIVDSAGNEVIGEVSYPSLDVVIASFTAEFSGEAYLN